MDHVGIDVHTRESPVLTCLLDGEAYARGCIYAADYHNNRVQVFSLSGELLTGWDVYSPALIARGPSGQLFISNLSASVYQFGALPTSVTRTNWGSLKAHFR